MIFPGNDFGGPELKNSAIRKALRITMQIAMSNRTSNYDDGREGWINPIFMVPGSIWGPEFEGYEIGHFSRKRKGVVIKIAVPLSVANGDDIPEFISYSLRNAVKLAADFFKQKDISFSTLKAEKVILKIEAALTKFSN